MDLTALNWWNKIGEENQNFFIEMLYKHSDLFGFCYNEETEKYELD